MDTVPFTPDAAALAASEDAVVLSFVFKFKTERQKQIAVSELEAWLKQIIQDALDENTSDLESV